MNSVSVNWQPWSVLKISGRPYPASASSRASDIGEHLSRHRDLGHLKGGVAPVANDLRADLDQLLAQQPCFKRDVPASRSARSNCRLVPSIQSGPWKGSRHRPSNPMVDQRGNGRSHGMFEVKGQVYGFMGSSPAVGFGSKV